MYILNYLENYRYDNTKNVNKYNAHNFIDNISISEDIETEFIVIEFKVSVEIKCGEGNCFAVHYAEKIMGKEKYFLYCTS